MNAGRGIDRSFVILRRRLREIALHIDHRGDASVKNQVQRHQLESVEIVEVWGPRHPPGVKALLFSPVVPNSELTGARSRVPFPRVWIGDDRVG